MGRRTHTRLVDRPNFSFLSNALDQLGPWKGKQVAVDLDWYQQEMGRKIRSIDWEAAKADVQRFLKPTDAKTLALWNRAFFLENLKRISNFKIN